MYAWLTRHYPQVTELYSPQALTDYRLALAAQNPQLAVKVSAMRIEVLRLVCLEAGMNAEQADDVSKQAFSIFYHHRSNIRSEEHTSELQSRPHLVCRLLLEKKKK